jgi:hypothetical protein
MCTLATAFVGCVPVTPRLTLADVPWVSPAVSPVYVNTSNHARLLVSTVALIDACFSQLLGVRWHDMIVVLVTTHAVRHTGSSLSNGSFLAAERCIFFGKFATQMPHRS